MNVRSVAMIAVSLLASGAQAAVPELIVRYRDPQNAAKLDAGATHAQVLNESEGVVRLQFDSNAKMLEARSVLAQNANVIRVSHNHWYRPALHLKSRPVTERPGFHMPTLMGFDIPPTGLPTVLLPPFNEIAGADPLADKDWAMKNIDIPSVQTTLYNLSPANELITAVIDTGVDYNHEDLEDAFWRSSADPAQVGFDFAHNNPQPYDIVKFDIAGCLKDPVCYIKGDQSGYLVNPGHGTHCAGHIGAVANNSKGIRGVGALATQVMGLKFFYDFGEPNAGSGDDAAAIKAIDFAITNGVKVISASWGGRSSATDAESSELKQAIVRAQTAGVIMVIAAGNDSINNDTDPTPSYPAAYNLDNIITVAAIDQNDQLADFSNYGANGVHIAAPGVKILSTTVGNNYSDVVATYTDQQGQQKEFDWDGTSMATPIVAGAVALVWAAHPTENYHQIRDRILNNARQLPSLAGKVKSGGTLDVAAAIR